MGALDLISLPLELVLEDFLLLELVDKRIFFLLDLSSDPIFLDKARLKVLNAHSDAVSLVFAKERLCGDITNGTLNIVPSLLCIFKLALNVRDFLRLKL